MDHQDMMNRIAAVKKTTPTERKLALYFERNHSSLAFENMESICTKTGVSQSSVSRFIVRLGFANFRAFTAAMRQDAANALDTPLKRYAAHATGASSENELLQGYINNVCFTLQETLEKLSPENFTRAIDLIADSDRHLFLKGGSFMGHLLGGFSILLRYVRGNFTLLTDDVSDMTHKIARREKNSILMAVSNNRYSTSTRQLLELFHNEGHETILITDSHSAPIYQYSTVPLVVQNVGTSTFNTRCPSLAVLEALAAGVHMRFKETLPEVYTEMIRLQDELGVYSVK